jgi:hypothetical protein
MAGPWIAITPLHEADPRPLATSREAQGRTVTPEIAGSSPVAPALPRSPAPPWRRHDDFWGFAFYRRAFLGRSRHVVRGGVWRDDLGTRSKAATTAPGFVSELG